MIIGDIETKVAFAGAARGAVASLVQALERLRDLQDTYVARGYAPSDTDEIVDDDIAAAKITAAQLSQLLNSGWLTSKLLQLMTEQAVSGTVAGFDIANRIRSDI
jgi:hypothetical protein